MMISDTLRGYAYLIGGLVLLLHTLGLFHRGLNVMFVLAAVAAMAYGLKISGLYSHIAALAKKDETPK